MLTVLFTMEEDKKLSFPKQIAVNVPTDDPEKAGVVAHRFMKSEASHKTFDSVILEGPAVPFPHYEIPEEELPVWLLKKGDSFLWPNPTNLLEGLRMIVVSEVKFQKNRILLIHDMREHCLVFYVDELVAPLRKQQERKPRTSQQLQLEVKGATIYERRDKTDLIYIQTNLPSPFLPVEGEGGLFALSFSAKEKTGAQYVREHLGIEPKVINMVFE